MENDATVLYLIRHGQTDANKNMIVMGATDVPLNDTGREQADSLGRRLNDLEVDIVYSSPLRRAVDTGRRVFGGEKTFSYDARLQEFSFGEWEGMGFDDIARQYPETWEMWFKDWSRAKIPGAETFTGFMDRVLTCLGEILERHKGERVAVISHGGCIRAILASFFSPSLSRGYWQFKIENAALTEIETRPELDVLIRMNYR